MGLLTELCTALQDELKLPAPTPVQSLVIPELLRPERESMAFLAATGSGKTLAYVLPLIQQLKQQEMFENYERRPKRPRMLILAPTRELAVQITQVVKSLSHSIKLSTQALVGGQDKGTQRKAMEGRPVDVVVATPGRLLQQWKDGNLYLGSIETVVLDEMDTMLEQVSKRTDVVIRVADVVIRVVGHASREDLLIICLYILLHHRASNASCVRFCTRCCIPQLPKKLMITVPQDRKLDQRRREYH